MRKRPLWGSLSDAQYQNWIDNIIPVLPGSPAGIIIDIGAGMGKVLAMLRSSHTKQWARLIGFEPAPTSVCNGWRLFRDKDIELHAADASALACLPNQMADAIISVGVLPLFSPLSYLCRSMLEQVRVLKPGGWAIHAWIVNGVFNWEDKLNLKPAFWGTSEEPLPACSAEIGRQLSQVILVHDNFGGPYNGYAVRLQKE